MFCAFENGDEIWEYLCCAYFPSTSKLEVRSNSGLDWFISNYKFDCLLNLGKVYSLLEKQDNLPHASEDELFDKRERGLAFDGSRSRIFDSSLLAEANKNTDDLSKFFSVLNIGLVQKDHEIRCATLSVLQKFFRKLPDIAKCDYDSLFFAVMEAYTNTQCDILIARCLDLSCNPQAFEIECVEVLRFYGTVINQIKLIGGRELVPHSVTVSIASILRETLYLVLASDEDFKKRGNLITLTLSLVPQRTATKSRRSFKYGDAPPADSKTFPGSLVAKVSASALAEALLVDFQSVSSSGAISVLINFIIHCSNIRLTESLLSTLLHVINFPDGRSSLSPRILHSFMSPLSLHPPVLAKGDVSSENLYLDDISSSFDQQLLTAKLSIICLLTSWPGVFSMGFSTSRRKAGFSSGISSLLNVLKVGHPKCRAVVLEILFHVFAIPFQKFVTDDGCDKDAIENDHLQYRLDEDFIIAEFDHWRDGSSVAELCWRSLRRRSVDMTAFHRVFLMATFIELGLIQSLKEAHLSSFSSKRVQESMRNLKDSSAQMELDFRYSVSYLLSYIFQTYLPVLPSSYKEYFTESIAPAAKNDCSPVDDVKSPDPVDFSNFDVTNTNEYYLSEDSLLPKASSSNVAIEDEAEVFSIRVIDSFLKLRLSQEGGGILGSSQGKRKQSSIFMEHLQGFYDHINSSDFMAGIPKTNSLKLDCHIIKLLYETNVFEHFETSSDAELIIIGENEASPFVPLPAAGESFLEASDKHKREERASFTVGSNLKLPWAQNKQKSVDHIEDPFLGYDINDVVTNSAGWNWVSICSCLRFFMYNCESGTSASGELQKKSLTFVKYLSMYFMPSNGLFSKESYKHLPPSQKNDMLKATYIAKIQAGSLLFRFLAAACAYSENCRSSNSDISANFMQDQNPYKEFSNLAERVFADLALSIEYELGMSLRKKSSSIHPLRSISTPLENSFQNGGPSCFSASSLPESMAQMYFIFLGGLPFSNRRLIFAKFQFLEMFINCLLSGSNEVLCKLILTCMHYDIESGASENCQLLEVALRASESRVVQMFALRFLSVLLSFWRETSPNVPWKEFGVKKVAWVVDMLFERVLSNDEHMRDLALTQLLELAQDPRCLPLMFSHERHLSLLNVGSDARCSGEVPPPPPPNETPAAKFLQLKALCIFSRYFNCIIDLQPNITARQRTFSKTNQFTTSVEDGTVKTDGLSVLLQEYKELGRESWLHVVLVDLWCQQAFCLRYAQYVDHLCNAAFLARHATDPHGHFLRTSHQSNALKITKSVPIPPHLFGELVGTPGGAKVLFHLAGKTIVNHVDQLINLNPPKRQLPQVKAAIWTIAHIASTAYGFNLLPKGAVVLLVRLAERCQVYSVCGVVTMALNLLCFEAQSILTSLGWTPCSKFYSERDESVTSVDVDFSVAVDCGEQVDESESLRIETEINDICKDFVSHKNRELRRLKRKAVSATQAATQVDSEFCSQSDDTDDDLGGFIELSLAKRLPKNVIEATRKSYNSSKMASDANPGASLVLPRRMEKFVCGRGGYKEGVDARGDSVSRSTCSSTASRQSEGPTANSSEDPRDYRDREDSWKDLPPVRGDRTSMVSNTDHVTPGTTPSHKPRYLTLRNETPSLSARPPTSSIDGVRFSVDSEEKDSTSANRATRTDSEISHLDFSGLNELSSQIPHEQAKCIQCKCFSLIQSISVAATTVEVPPPTPLKSGGENEQQGSHEQEQVFLLPWNYREKVLFWTIKMCTFSALETAQAMKDFFQKYVYCKKDPSPVCGVQGPSGGSDPETGSSSSTRGNLVRVSRSQLLCLYSDCLVFLRQNPSSLSGRFFLHSLFQPLVSAQLALLQKEKLVV